MRASKVLFLAILLSGPARAATAYDANGVPLGANEMQVKKAFPTAFCKPLEWASRAADRRCDDAKTAVAGIEARITFYLRKDVVQAFDIRFETRDLDRFVSYLKSRYGKPFSEAKEASARDKTRETYKVRWEKDNDKAVLVSQLDQKRSALTVSRGDFEDEIYRVR